MEVIECLIRVPVDNLLDIADPKSEQSKQVNKFSEAFFAAALKNNKPINMDDRLLDGKILDLVCKKK